MREDRNTKIRRIYPEKGEGADYTPFFNSFRNISAAFDKKAVLFQMSA